MTWSYRIVRYAAGGYGLHEVFCDDDGGESWTQDPVTFGCYDDEGPNGIVLSLTLALKDAQTHPVLQLPDEPNQNAPQFAE